MAGVTKPNVVLEVCVDTIDGAVAAQQGGADRIELCASLFEGGITPSAATIEVARHHLTIGINVMIRPRGGDFCYSELEQAVMRRDVEIAKDLGADGVVIGALLPDASIDQDLTADLIRLARPLSVTFHRAFDLTPDPAAALDTLIALGVDRLLTSGQEASALEGSDLIAALVQQAADRIVVMAGGGIHERNIARIVHLTAVPEAHMSGRSLVESPMTARNSRVSMGGALHFPDYQRWSTGQDRIHKARAQLNTILAQSASRNRFTG